jgi:hypothetical protein
MTTAFLKLSRRRNLLHRLGRLLAIVTQVVVLLAPLAEGREERALGPHVEAPRTVPHPGHRADTCAECTLLTLHGRTEERSQLSELIRDAGASQLTSATHPLGIEREPSNSSRAPPL